MQRKIPDKTMGNGREADQKLHTLPRLRLVLKTQCMWYSMVVFTRNLPLHVTDKIRRVFFKTCLYACHSF